MRRRPLLLLMATAAAVGAPRLPYDESADARATIRAALGAVGAGPRRVLIVFGANWCEDCRALDQALKSGRNAELMAREFTLTDLQRTVEAISGRHLHKQNFRRLVEAAALVEPTGESSTATGGRPAALFRFRREVVQERPAPGLRLGARPS